MPPRYQAFMRTFELIGEKELSMILIHYFPTSLTSRFLIQQETYVLENFILQLYPKATLILSLLQMAVLT